MRTVALRQVHRKKLTVQLLIWIRRGDLWTLYLTSIRGPVSFASLVVDNHYDKAETKERGPGIDVGLHKNFKFQSASLYPAKQIYTERHSNQHEHK